MRFTGDLNAVDTGLSIELMFLWLTAGICNFLPDDQVDSQQ